MMSTPCVLDVSFKKPFCGRARASTLTIPWCTYTDPEVAHVGLYDHEARAQGLKTQTFEHRLEDVDRAILDGETDHAMEIFSPLHQKRVVRDLVSESVLEHVGQLGEEALLVDELDRFELSQKLFGSLPDLSQAVHQPAGKLPADD